jgi:hypothetical protein
MAVRVRKLAKDLQRTPAVVVGILHALGHTRYRSADDMLPAAIEEAVRRGLVRGVRPVEVVLLDAPPARSTASEPTVADDLMARLVPGVARPGARPAAPSPARPSDGPPVAVPSTIDPARGVGPAGAMRSASGPSGLEAELRRLETERASLDSHARRLASERAVLQAERAAFAEEQAAWSDRLLALDEERVALRDLAEVLASERAALDAERASVSTLAERARGQAGTDLVALLVERGLRGVDEQERALGALASSKSLRDVLPALKVVRVDEVRKVLRDRLVLVEPSVADPTAVGGVAVAPERAEIPAPAILAQRLSQLSERLLLAGLRRVVVVGGKPAWHRLLRDGVDPRIELRTVTGQTRDGAQAAHDVERGDLVVLAGVDVSASAQSIYNASRAEVVSVTADTLGDLVGAWIAKL